jgi:hypothetical protein
MQNKKDNNPEMSDFQIAVQALCSREEKPGYHVYIRQQEKNGFSHLTLASRGQRR